MDVELLNEFETNIRRGFSELMILRLLKDRDMTSYELPTELAKRTNTVFKIQYATIYMSLRRLEKKNMITVVHKKKAQDSRLLNYYHIEDLGREYLTYGTMKSRIVLSEFLKLIES